MPRAGSLDDIRETKNIYKSQDFKQGGLQPDQIKVVGNVNRTASNTTSNNTSAVQNTNTFTSSNLTKFKASQVISEENEEEDEDYDDNEFEVVDNVEMADRILLNMQSTSFLIKVMSGRVPRNLLDSQISQPDLENLQQLLPKLNT